MTKCHGNMFLSHSTFLAGQPCSDRKTEHSLTSSDQAMIMTVKICQSVVEHKWGIYAVWSQLRMWPFHVNIYKETIFNCWRVVLEMIKFWKAHPQWKSYHVHLVTSECCTTKLWKWHFQFDNLVYWFCRYTYLVSKCQHKVLSHLVLRGLFQYKDVFLQV